MNNYNDGFNGAGNPQNQADPSQQRQNHYLNNQNANYNLPAYQGYSGGWVDDHRNPPNLNGFGVDGQPLIGGENEQGVNEDQQRRELAYKKQVDSLIGEMVYGIMIMLCIAGFVMANKDSDCQSPVKMWLAVAMGSYLADFILLMTQYHFLKKNKKDNILIMATRFIVLCFLTSWLIYGNVIYYKQASNDQTCSNGLKIIMFLVLLIGYFEMLKCCCIGMVVCVMIPFLFFAVRRAQRPNWVPAAPQFVQNLYKTRFNPQQNQAFEQCAICLLDFEENVEITPLPCDEKHYFHPDCIKQWLATNNNCPLCKKPITKEALKEQKRRLRR